MSSYRPTLPEGWRWRDGLGRGFAASESAWCRIVERSNPKHPGATRMLVCLDGDVPDDVVEACLDDAYEPVACSRGDDWIRIGGWDGTRTRSIWVRLTFMGPTRMCRSDSGEPLGEVRGPCVSIELCAGRAGSDDYVKILPTDVSDACFSLLVGLLKSQLWALEER